MLRSLQKCLQIKVEMDNQNGTMFQIILIQNLKNAGASCFVLVLGALCSAGTPYIY